MSSSPNRPTNRPPNRPMAIANVRLTTNSFPVHVLNGAYRGPCFNSNAFITETFIDECAHGAGIDPQIGRAHV